MRIKFYITRLPHSEGIPLPKYQTDGSAGVDLPAAIENSANIQPGARLLVPTGFAFSMPSTYEAQVRPRSGLALKYGITVLNSPGTIDSDYRGELMVLATWIGEGDFIELSKGERIAQMLIAPVPVTNFREVSFEELSTTERGEGGFGSSGRF